MNTAKITPDVRNTLISSTELGLSVFVINGAQILGIKTFQDLIDAYERSERGDHSFKRVFGKKSREEIRRKIIVKNATHLRVVRDTEEKKQGS